MRASVILSLFSQTNGFDTSEYMGGYGYEVGHSTIIHGIDVVPGKVESDEDYQKIVKALSQHKV